MINIYIKRGASHGNAYCIARIIYAGQATDVTLYTSVDEPYYYFSVYLKLLRFIYAKHAADKPINIYLSSRSDIGILQHLGIWSKHNWPMAKQTSGEIKQQAKQDHVPNMMTKIPLNYSSVLPQFKALAKAQQFFPHLNLKYYNRSNAVFNELSDKGRQMIAKLPMTTAFKNGPTQCKFSIAKPVLNKLRNIAKGMHINYRSLLRQIVTDYVKKH